MNGRRQHLFRNLMRRWLRRTRARVCARWCESLEREQLQAYLQRVPEEELVELLRRTKHALRTGDTGEPRNGYGKPRQLARVDGTVTVREPRVLNLEDRFERGTSPLF